MRAHEPKGQDPHDPSQTRPQHSPRLQVRGLSTQIDGRVILHGLDFALAPGEILGVVGASGCGKSTLLRHLIGLTPPAAGQVCFEGLDLHRASPSQLRAAQAQMGMQFQAGALWSTMTVGENLMLPLRQHTRLSPIERQRRAIAALTQVGLQDQFQAMPGALSGGMTKRVSLARALVLQPKLLLLDEPSSGLDPINSAHVHQLIAQLSRDHQMSVVMVSHDTEKLCQIADRILFLDADQKTMLALDTPAALLASGPEAVQDFLRHASPMGSDS